VAVLAFFRSLGVSKRLSVLVEGESLFNDGVAIVIFNIAVAAGAVAAGQGGEPFTLTAAVGEFLKVSFGGLAVGVGLGLVVSYVILKNVDVHLIETATTVALAFGSFVIAEELHVSGILAVVAAGLFVGNIGTQNTSPTTKVTLDNFWEFAAFVVNSLVFLLIGLETDILDERPNLIPIVVAVLAVLLSRAIIVYSFTWLHGRLNKQHRIPVPYRHVMYWGGLRGAISLALALTLTGATFGEDVADELKLMTFGVVLFTLLVQGITIAPLIRKLGLSKKPERQIQQQRRQALLHSARAGQEELDKLHSEGILPDDVWQAMDEAYKEELDRRNQQLRDLLSNFPELEQEIVLQAREDLLRAERSAIGDLNRRGLISDQVYHDLIRETDSRSAALDLIYSTWGMGNKALDNKALEEVEN
jgi:CPA1 family monovalent cation:H+ antiporter